MVHAKERDGNHLHHLKVYPQLRRGKDADYLVHRATEEKNDDPPDREDAPADIVHRKDAIEDELQDIGAKDETDGNREPHPEVVERVGEDECVGRFVGDGDEAGDDDKDPRNNGEDRYAPLKVPACRECNDGEDHEYACRGVEGEELGGDEETDDRYEFIEKVEQGFFIHKKIV